jgi:hypothetical protein
MGGARYLSFYFICGLGVLLLVFGLQWLRKGIRRVAARRFTGRQIPMRLYNRASIIASATNWPNFLSDMPRRRTRSSYSSIEL